MSADRRRFLRFLLVGAVNTGFGYAVYALLVLAGMRPGIALAIAFAIGVAWNFSLHARIVFRTRGLARVPHYIAVYLGLYSVNALVLRLALDAGIPPLVAQFFIAGGIAVLSFVLIGWALTGRLGGRDQDASGGKGR